MNQRYRDLRVKRLELQQRLEEITRSIRNELENIEIELREYIECHCPDKIHTSYEGLTRQTCCDDCDSCEVWYCPDCIEDMGHTTHPCFRDH